MENNEIPFDVRADIAQIKLTLERVIGHQTEMKIDFKGIGKDLKEVVDLFHVEKIERIEGDTKVSNECKESERRIYKSVAAYGVTTIVVMLGGIIGYLAYKT
jgi:hypothetical protein